MYRLESRLKHIEKIVKPKDEDQETVLIIQVDGDGLPEDYREWLTYKEKKDSSRYILLFSNQEIEARKRQGVAKENGGNNGQ